MKLVALIKNKPSTWHKDNIFYLFLNLIHLPLVSHICFSELGQHWFRYWLVAYSALSHYPNQRWDVINWTLRNKLQWNFNQNTNIFIQENVSENIICGRCVNRWSVDSPRQALVTWKAFHVMVLPWKLPLHMMTSSNGNIFLLAICAGNSPVPGEFPAQRPVTQSFDVFFDLRLNKRLSK